MAVSKGMTLVSYPAKGDLSAKQYFCITINSSGDAAVAGRAATVHGVLQNDPAAAGRAASVAIGGITKVGYSATVSGGAISIGSALISSTVGRAVVESTGGTGYVWGRSLEAATTSTSATGLISALITHEGPQSTA